MNNYLLEFELEGLPRTTNSLVRSQWRARHNHAVMWKQAVFTKCWHLRPDEPLTKARITITRHSAKCPDFDGMVSASKHVVDGLIQAKIIIDDNMVVVGIPTYLWQRASPRKGKITVKVEGVNDAAKEEHV